MLSFCHILATDRLSVMMMLPHYFGGFKGDYALNSNDEEAYTTLIGLRNMLVVWRLAAS